MTRALILVLFFSLGSCVIADRETSDAGSNVGLETLSDIPLAGDTFMEGSLFVAGNVSTTGVYKHPPVTHKVQLFGPTLGAASRSASYALVNISPGQSVIAQIFPMRGKTITAIRARGFDSATGPTRLRVRLVYNDPTDYLTWPSGVGSTPGVNNNYTLRTADFFEIGTSTGTGDEQVVRAGGTQRVGIIPSFPSDFTAKSYYIIVDTIGGSAVCRLQDLEYDEKQD